MPWRLPWPLPALLCWALAWALLLALGAAGAPAAVALPLACLGAVAAASAVAGRWRRWIAAGGFPLSAALLGAAPGVGAWTWAVALLALLLLYPLRAWRDAPFFPTPLDALDGLAPIVQPAPASVLDVGCGAGHGLGALRRVWPAARLDGLEWSAPLAALARWRVRGASVQRADMWARSWAGHDLVYVFQRPETMARAWAKARAELAPGAWFVSLEFEVPGVVPLARVGAAGARPVWVYRIGTPAHRGR